MIIDIARPREYRSFISPWIALACQANGENWGDFPQPGLLQPCRLVSGRQMLAPKKPGFPENRQKNLALKAR
ncbi:hypothetical protein J2Z31_001603 [Sinorhizobium kostiense]|uniref:Uncharacterized protein n=1 Tax=Sinorhizobium kostiense TaxID=76747 RepID=A0ABS4QWT5_9HYPH|nr:hypothetical protein [Sinorhizobium kostiense]MBP2235111.1 hypothetical protein [Sinorhizobium kostiense]